MDSTQSSPRVSLDPHAIAATSASGYSQLKIAVIIPCYNEDATIAQVIAQFRHELPDADIHVFDNNSSDRTVDFALKAGAQVTREPRQGKGNVVKSMFRKVTADLYIMVDGDGTYPAEKVHDLLAPALRSEADMVVGSRLMSDATIMKAPNLFGNRLFRISLNSAFGSQLTDILSGYRVMTHEFVRSICVLSEGFQIETELTIQALFHKMRIVEVPVSLTERPSGSHSKIRVISDGFKILWMILDLYRTYRPLTVFGGGGLLMIAAGSILGGIVVIEFLETGLVRRFPTAILATGMVLAGFLAVSVGLILNTLMRSFQETHYKILLLEERLQK